MAFLARAARNPLGFRDWVAAWRSSSWLLGSSRWAAAPSRSGAGARTASEKRPSGRNESLPPPIKGAAAADRGPDNSVRLLPLFLAAQQGRSLSRFGGSATEIALGAAAAAERNVWCVALEMKEQFERCGAAFSPDCDAFVCSYECTFCPRCADTLGVLCRNCGGELRSRPRRRNA